MSEIDVLLPSTGNFSLETLHTLTTRSTRLAQKPGRHESPRSCTSPPATLSSPCYTVSGSMKMYLFITSPAHHGVTWRPFSPAVAAAALCPPFDVAAPQRLDVAAPVVCATPSSPA